MNENKSNQDADPDEGVKVGALLELMSAYQQSQVLFAFLELGIPALLKTESLSSAQCAQKLDIDPLAMERFLNAAVSVGLLTRDSSGYSNSKMSAAFLTEGEKFYLRGQAERHRARSAPVWGKLTSRLRQWRYGAAEESAPETDDQGAEAMTDQHNLALLHGFALAGSFDFSKHRRVLDLGGGTGATSIALCRSHPQLTSTVFDLPENIQVAREFIEKEDLPDRISTIGGDFKTDDLPADFDVVLLANFMAVNDAAENKRLLEGLYEKLPAGGSVPSEWLAARRFAAGTAARRSVLSRRCLLERAHNRTVCQWSNALA